MLPFPFFKGGLPKWLNQSFVNNDITKFVEDMVQKSITSSMKHVEMADILHAEREEAMQTNPIESFQVTTFESHDHVYVRMYIKNAEQLSNLKIYHNTNQLIIEGLPTPESRHVLTLPSMVKMKDSVSEYRDNYLQIKMKKRMDPQFTEVAVPPME
ncbi:Hsp20/alpha crystallin family protein [Neobacillus sp. SCS-31]|uniref:Hsp20/alpha crystallin family protein n=1 Tax=Neobacillus oceani TaxID=3115292 RepID=UPI0039067681